MPFDAVLSGAFWGQLLVLCLSGVALVAVGVACGLAAARQRRAPDAFAGEDVEFMANLSTHDTGAAEMAMLACRHSQAPAVRAFALEVVVEQHERIGRVAGWRDLRAREMDQSHRSDTGPLRVLRRATGRRFDVLFLEWMLRNREDTIAVAVSVVDTTENPAVAALAEDILERHQRQLQVLQEMAAERGQRSYR